MLTIHLYRNSSAIILLQQCDVSVIKFTTLTGGGKDNELLIDPFLSGNYLVTEVRHLAQTKQQGIHTMTLTCIKDSVGVDIYLMIKRTK